MPKNEDNNISLDDIYFFMNSSNEFKFTDFTKKRIIQSYERVQKMALSEKAVYGINTGFGPLCSTKISTDETESLQKNLLLSHSVGVGNPIAPELSKLMLICKIQSLSKGYSGIRLEILDRLIYFIQNNLTPFVPEKGSVGASGDLAPLAHLFLPLIGNGFFWDGKEKVKAASVLKKHNLTPFFPSRKRRTCSY